MPIKNNHIFKEVGGEFMIIPLEGDNVNYSKVYNLNEVGAFIYTKIKEKDDINYVLEELLKATYLISAIFITLYSFGLIAVSFVLFLTTLLIGNLILRIVYELSILLVKICHNTTEINSKLK